LALGVPHPDYLSRTLNAYQMAEWEAYFSLEPMGDQRADLHAAQVCHWLYEVNRTKRGRRMKLSDFVLDFEPDKAQTPAKMKATLTGISKSIDRKEEKAKAKMKKRKEKKAKKRKKPVDKRKK
jgi:hypothetical protein